jgi:hypothetical protein
MMLDDAQEFILRMSAIHEAQTRFEVVTGKHPTHVFCSRDFLDLFPSGYIACTLQGPCKMEGVIMQGSKLVLDPGLKGKSCYTRRDPLKDYTGPCLT